MPELPEIMVLSRQMDEQLSSKEFESVDVVQEKCLNVSVDDFAHRLAGKTVVRVHSRGKWIFCELSDDYHLLLNLGMGANILHYGPGQGWPDEYQCRFHFTDKSGFTCKFWWFGHLRSTSPPETSRFRPWTPGSLRSISGDCAKAAAESRTSSPTRARWAASGTSTFTTSSFSRGCIQSAR